MPDIMKSWATHAAEDNTDAVCVVVARCFGITREQLTEQTSLLDDLGSDSIDLLAMASDLENEFDVLITDEDIRRVRTIGDTVLCVIGALELQRVQRGPTAGRKHVTLIPNRALPSSGSKNALHNGNGQR